jgi:NAD(P)-dependent dehydrogenase (short-subunit alcohol dehydrogenase family)
VAQGARVRLGGRNREALAAVAEALGPDRAIPAARDLEDLDGACAWVGELTQEFGPLAGIVHSAGIRSGQPLRLLKQAHLAKVLALHVEVPLGLIKGFRQRRPKGLPGSIVLLSSVLGLVGSPLETAYSAAKAALGGVVRSAALELAPEGIRVNAIAPGYVQTEMLEGLRQTLTEEQFAQIVNRHPLGLGQPEDVAHAAVFLLGGTARWITGTTLVVDGGYTAQ